MQLKQISVYDLFGSLKHIVPLSEDGITFIHGPNGCGKTTLLRIVSSLLGREIQTLKSIDFSKLKLLYADGCELVVDRSKSKDNSDFLFDDEARTIQTDVDIVITLLDEKGKALHKFEYSKQIKKISTSDLPFSIMSIERMLPFLNRTGPREWTDMRNGQLLGIDSVISKYSERLNIKQHFQWPQWLTDRLELTKVGFVKTQRLINITAIAKSGRHDESREPRDVVEIYSNQIRETIARKLAESAIQSQARDRSFPQRLINKDFKQNVPQSVFAETYKATEERAQSLMSAGLLDQAASIPLPNKTLTKLERDVLALYLSDFNEKLNAFTILQRKIETLIEIVGSKLRRKRFQINRQKGFVFETNENTPRQLTVTDLSSGEQHQLVLFYELLFLSEGTDIIFIDEPEISLHVEWQRAFINDLEKVKNLTGASFLIATHSPQIINNRRDLAVPLDGGL